MISSPSCFSLQPLRALSHWAIWYCFAELLGDMSTALFHRQLDISRLGSSHLNKSRCVPSCQVVSMLCLKL
ncbi:hypothetical protein H5410_035892 [Solanum commersonii]|uniref:Uncharacterized protein n=1 Tax=Solanum commersonii TaxID=4109 RepID=A0A9J5Y604_SOLCO|nr:hypothetical protein H5410_035892 [Solanum commersonii]